MRPLATLRHRNPDTCGHAVCIRFLTASRLLYASSHTLFLEFMPKLKRGSGHRHKEHKPKQGTKNVHQVSARDKRAADAAAAELQAAAEALAALDEPAPAPAEEQPSLEPEPACEPSNGELASYKRMAIVSHYQRLGCPPESEWGKNGGTLRQLADAFDMPDPCDFRPIKEVLLRYLNGEDVWYSKGGQGRKTKLTAGQQLIAADCLRRGLGQVQSAHVITAWRETKGMGEKEAAVSERTVRTAVAHMGGVVQRRGTTSTGKEAVSRMLCLGDRYRVIISCYIQFFAILSPNYGHFFAVTLYRYSNNKAVARTRKNYFFSRVASTRAPA